MNTPLKFETIGRLRCAVFDPPGTDPASVELVAIFCHGFGAPGDDLVPFGPHLASLLGPEVRGIRYYFPEAPLSLESVGMPGSRAWWMLDLQQLQMAAEGKLTRDQRDTLPEGLEDAREALSETVELILKETGLTQDRVMIGGFSQGSMVTTELALQSTTTPAALVIYSGTLLCEQRWRTLAEQKDPFQVFQSHGTSDSILPFSGGEALHSLFKESGFDAEFLSFSGPHTIPAESLVRTAEILAEIRSQN